MKTAILKSGILKSGILKSNAMTSPQILAYYRKISTEMFTVVDLETTGGRGNFDRIIEISVLQATLEGGIQNISTNLINPQIPVPAQITRFTGISSEMVETVLPAAKILPNYLPRLQTGILTAHNLSFDYGFLGAEYRRIGVDFRADFQLCTVELSRLLLPDLPSRSLPNLVKHFGFRVGKSHRAEADTMACWLLLELLLRQILTTNDQEILDIIGRQWLTQKDAMAILRQRFNFDKSHLRKSHSVKAILENPDIKSRFSERRQIRLYQRQSLENFINTFESGQSKASQSKASQSKKATQKVIAEQLSLPI